MKSLISALFMISIGNAVYAKTEVDYDKKCQEIMAAKIKMGKPEIDMCSMIKNDYALKCIQALGPKSYFYEIQSCAEVDNTLMVNCVEKIVPEPYYKQIQACIDQNSIKKAIMNLKDNLNNNDFNKDLEINGSNQPKIIQIPSSTSSPKQDLAK